MKKPISWNGKSWIPVNKSSTNELLGRALFALHFLADLIRSMKMHEVFFEREMKETNILRGLIAEILRLNNAAEGKTRQQ